MKTYSVSCKINSTNKNSSVKKTKQNRIIFLSNCVLRGKKRLKNKTSIK